jgi:hypothetical protein
MTEKFNLSKKIFKCPFAKTKCQALLNVLDVKKFIRLCEDNSEEINGKSYIKISDMQKFAGDNFR